MTGGRRPEPSEQRGQRGQVLVLAALLSAVLLGFLGLVVDAGQLAAAQQAGQSAADGAALTAVYSISTGSTEAAATTAAGNVLTAVGLPPSALSLAYLDSSGSPTANASSVATVQATVSQARATFFLGALGIRAFTATATASASLAESGTACALCVMAAFGTAFSEGASAQVQVTGGAVVVDSTGNPNLSLASGASLNAPAVTIAGGAYSLGSGATIMPAPVVGAVASDPLAGLAEPSVGGTASNYVSPSSGTGSILPGVYSGITVSGRYRLRLQPGVYVLTGPLEGAGGTVTGSGVLIYLACPSYPSGCGGPGAYVGVGSGSINLSAASSGTYAGVAVFADPGNTATNTVGSGTLTLTGSLYGASMPLALTQSGDSATVNGQLVAASVSVAPSSQLTVAYSASSRSTILRLSP